MDERLVCRVWASRKARDCCGRFPRTRNRTWRCCTTGCRDIPCLVQEQTPMKRALCTVLLLFLSLSAAAQQRTVLVRLFWQHPPTDIRVTPEGASLRSCENCAAGAALAETASRPLGSQANFVSRPAMTC